MNNYKIILTTLVFLFTACGNNSSNPNEPSNGSNGATTIPINAKVVNIQMGAAGKGTSAFGTNPLIVKVGTIVAWLNLDIVPHTSSSTTGLWDSGALTTGQNFAFQFKTVGTFPYFCSIHGAASMSGIVEVTP